MKEDNIALIATNLPYKVGNTFKLQYDFPTSFAISDDG